MSPIGIRKGATRTPPRLHLLLPMRLKHELPRRSPGKILPLRRITHAKQAAPLVIKRDRADGAGGYAVRDRGRGQRIDEIVAKPGTDEIDRHAAVEDDDHLARWQAIVKLRQERCEPVFRVACRVAERWLELALGGGPVPFPPELCPGLGGFARPVEALPDSVLLPDRR